MSRSAARSTTTLALVLLAIALTASGGTEAASTHGRMLGVVPHIGGHASSLRSAATTTGSGPVVYHGGQVMHTNTTYAIFWVPSGYAVDANYVSLIDRYFSDVAAASETQSSVYSAASQYYDSTGSIQYKSAFGGAYVDTHPFPPNGCDDGLNPKCLTDQQIQEELQNLLTTKGWHAGTSTMFFLMTPKNVGSCFDNSGAECTTNRYCAYHSDFIDTNSEHVIYANQPYIGTIAGCTRTAPSSVGTQGFPNDHDADATINAISHEHIEAITDPFGDAWWTADGVGDEVADLCVRSFGADAGAPIGGQHYDQLINGHPYSLQLEYSNDNGDCVSSYTPTAPPGGFSAPVVTGAAGVGHVLATSNGAWTHAPSGYAYRWQRCAATGTGCADVAAATAATYRLTAADVGHTLRNEVTAHNTAGTSAMQASNATAVVAASPTSTGPPVLVGTAAVGRTLSVSAGSWNAPATFKYAWLRCNAIGTGCSAIAGATSPLYVARKADRAHTLEVRVAATNAAGSATAFSAHSGLVLGVPSATKAPHVSGGPRVGRKLSATRGSWSDAPNGYRYQWLRCNAHGESCVRIHGATHSKYRLTKRDAHHKLRIRITAVNVAGSGKATSRASASVSR